MTTEEKQAELIRQHKNQLLRMRDPQERYITDNSLLISEDPHKEEYIDSSGDEGTTDDHQWWED